LTLVSFLAKVEAQKISERTKARIAREGQGGQDRRTRLDAELR
jgi:hypothetical protein